MAKIVTLGEIMLRLSPLWLTTATMHIMYQNCQSTKSDRLL